MAAGKGERLWPITETIPKPCIPVMCKPLIRWHLDALEQVPEIDEIIIVIGYMKEKIISLVNSFSLKKKIRYVEQEDELGTGHAVKTALEKIGVTSEPILITYSDLFLGEWDLYSTLASSGENVIVGVPVPDPENYGVLYLRDNNQLEKIVEKPSKPSSNLINAGIYVIRPNEIIKYINTPPSPRGEIEFTDAINKAVSEGGLSIAVKTIDKESWIDIGLPWNLLEANKLALDKFLEDILGSNSKECPAYIEGPAYIGDKTTIKPGTYIEGPVYIGENAKIGPNTRIRPYTVICNNTRIGFSVEIKSSLIMEHAKISHFAYVGDSIICDHVNLGAGTMIANLRFDDKPVKSLIRGKMISSGRRKFGSVIGSYAKTGVNVSVLPGVKIGCYSWIYPGVIVAQDVPSHSFYKVSIKPYITPIKNEKGDEDHEDADRRL